MTAFELLKQKSSALPGSIAWQHLDSIGNGYTAWDLLVDASSAPASSTAWIHLNALVIGKPLRQRNLLRSVGKMLH